ncbi:stress response protein NST1-like [Larimichthys crocea]|uniref:stress response protein NST1-like n=1 Tax=Larimichthys crocea TaxID=215358 RepID=UPI000F5EB82F|nr:stress response protein NST1-like [Larimichthys crocea]
MQGLREALCSAITEIKSVKEENKALKEGTGQQMEKLLEQKQLMRGAQEEVKMKEEEEKERKEKEAEREGYKRKEGEQTK